MAAEPGRFGRIMTVCRAMTIRGASLKPASPTQPPRRNRPAANRAGTAVSHAPSSARGAPQPSHTDAESAPASASAAGHSAMLLRPDQVLHHRIRMPPRRRQGQPGDRADMQFELARRAGVDRPVAGVVRPRRDLVHQHLARRLSTNISTASSPTRSSASAHPPGDRLRRRDRPPARSGPAPASRRGYGCGAGSPPCRTAATAAVQRHVPTTTLISQAKSTKPSSTSGFGTSRSNAGVEVVRRAAASPGPCRHSPAGWSSAPPAGPDARTAASSSCRELDRPPRAPWRRRPALRKLFSAMRSWLIRSTDGAGRTGRQRGQQIQPLGADVLELEADDVHRRRRTRAATPGRV